MRIIFDPVAMQYIVDFGTRVDTYNSIEDLKNRQLPSDQALRTEYYFGSDRRGHSHPPGNGCRYCGSYIDVRGSRARHCPYSEF